MSCRILIQIKKSGEDFSIQDYFKYEANLTQEIDYKNLLTVWCDSIQSTIKTIYLFKDNKKIKGFNLNGQPPQPYRKGVVYNEVEIDEELCKKLNCDSRLTSWIYIECIN